MNDPEGHWARVAREFKLANETLQQKKDQLISMVRKFEVVNFKDCVVG